MSSRQALPSSYRADSRPPFDRAAPLRAEIYSPFLTFLVGGAQRPLGQDRGRSGFRSIWASGLTISASLSNEASWTQVLECWPTPRNCPSS